MSRPAACRTIAAMECLSRANCKTKIQRVNLPRGCCSREKPREEARTISAHVIINRGASSFPSLD